MKRRSAAEKKQMARKGKQRAFPKKLSYIREDGAVHSPHEETPVKVGNAAELVVVLFGDTLLGVTVIGMTVNEPFEFVSVTEDNNGLLLMAALVALAEGVTLEALSRVVVAGAELCAVARVKDKSRMRDVGRRCMLAVCVCEEKRRDRVL